jgi:streptomycin 6-kinase
MPPRIERIDTSTGPAILKRVSDLSELRWEAETLRAFGDHRAVAVKEVRVEDRALLLEDVHPGDTLAAIAGEESALEVVSKLFAEGWPELSRDARVPPLSAFLSSLTSASGAVGEIDSQRISLAQALSRRLQDGSRVAHLHGDLHYGNILLSNRAGYLLIDPKGVSGDPAFDIGYLVSRTGPTPRHPLALAHAMARRLEVLPKALHLDPRRVAAYAYVAAVISAIWAIEDGDRIAGFQQVIVALEEFPIVRAAFQLFAAQ